MTCRLRHVALAALLLPFAVTLQLPLRAQPPPSCRFGRAGVCPLLAVAAVDLTEADLTEADADHAAEQSAIQGEGEGSFAGRVVPLRRPQAEPPQEVQPARGQMQAVNLIKEYGPTYLLTSIALSLCSFALCYVGVAHAVHVGSLPAWCSNVARRSGRAGVVGIAYATHKALSPLRVPVVLALMKPIARWRGRAEDGAANLVAS